VAKRLRSNSGKVVPSEAETTKKSGTRSPKSRIKIEGARPKRGSSKVKVKTSKKTDALKCPIAFPTLLCGIMLDQHPSLITVVDIPEKRESPLALQPKLFSANHVPDIVGTSGNIPATGLMTKQNIVDALKDTCVILDERKAQFEIMIHALENEDVATAGEQEESDEEEADAANEDQEDGDEEGAENSDSNSDVAD